MRIYTKTGDLGETALYGGRRVLKSDLQVETYGTVDELSSFLGLCIAKITALSTVHRLPAGKASPPSTVELIDIQRDLWKIMASLSGSKDDLSFLDGRLTSFENKIDELTAKLPPLRRFILPGGNEASSLFHVARAVCRRAERRCVELLQKKSTIYHLPSIIKYLNRLSDLLFTYARWYGRDSEITTK